MRIWSRTLIFYISKFHFFFTGLPAILTIGLTLGLSQCFF